MYGSFGFIVVERDGGTTTGGRVARGGGLVGRVPYSSASSNASLIVRFAVLAETARRLVYFFMFV